jgi:hypothetical protein
MHTRKLPATKNRFLVLILAGFACMLFFPGSSFAEKKKPTGANKVIPFGITDTARTLHTSYDQILKNPQLLCSDKKCKVTSFQISYVVAEGADPYMGPFQISGAELTPMVKDLIIKLKKSESKKTRVFVEEIHVNRKGVDVAMNPIVLICNP